MIIVFGIILFTGLAILSWIDIKTFRLPDIGNLLLALIGVAQAYMLTGSVVMSLIGIAIGYGALVALEITFKKIRGKDGIGRGDAKLLAVGGAWCGAMALPFIVLVASLTGLLAVISTKITKKASDTGQKWIPFGPFLALGIFCVWIWQQAGLI
jgi:prepilin signal peptidase PulO-like enzyme (type II secretory pathway)